MGRPAGRGMPPVPMQPHAGKCVCARVCACVVCAHANTELTLCTASKFCNLCTGLTGPVRGVGGPSHGAMAPTGGSIGKCVLCIVCSIFTLLDAILWCLPAHVACIFSFFVISSL